MAIILGRYYSLVPVSSGLQSHPVSSLIQSSVSSGLQSHPVSICNISIAC